MADKQCNKIGRDTKKLSAYKSHEEMKKTNGKVHTIFLS